MTAHILPSPLPNISLDPDSLSTMANPPASRFSQPRSDSAVSVSESWRRHAARLRLFEKLSMSHFSRAPVRGMCEASVSHRISAPYSNSAECEAPDPVPTHPPDKIENAPPRATRRARAYGLLPSEMTASLGKQAADILVPHAQSAVHKPRPAPSSEGHGEHYSSGPKTRGASMVVRMARGIGA